MTPIAHDRLEAGADGVEEEEEEEERGGVDDYLRGGAQIGDCLVCARSQSFTIRRATGSENES